MWKIVAMFVFVGAIASCKRGAPPPRPSPAVLFDAALAPSASAAVEVDPDLPLKHVATQWSDAINAKDMATLGAIHGAYVRFYGLMVDNATYCAKMKAALAKDPSFHQSIDSIRVEWPRPTRAKLWFRKKDNKAEHAAYLIVDKLEGSWKIVEESDLVTDANIKCLMSADEITLTGTIDEGYFMWHDSSTPTTVLVLKTPICVIRSGNDDWDDWYGGRIDGVDSITLVGRTPTVPIGTKMRVVGSHAQPHNGSGHYSTPLLLMVESMTKVP